MDSNDSAPMKPGTLRLSWRSLRDAIVALPKIFLRVGPALVALQLVQSGATQGIDFAVEKFQLMGREDLLLLALVAGVQMLFTLIWSAIWVITVTTAASRVFDRTEDGPGFGYLMVQHLNQIGRAHV
jgi:hypothetical protein